MLNLEKHLNEIASAQYLGERKELMVSMIMESHAKETTKTKALMQVSQMTNPDKVLQFAYNYALSGEGHKVV
jgi:hypothetical protein